MLTTLHIKNIGIIDDITIECDEGFNAFTGETGAGKTLIIGALEIVAGGRFSKEMIRKGETYSFVEACFYMPDKEFAIDGNVIISREIYSNGRNSCKINGRLVTVTELKEFMSKIIDIHGQHDNQFIMKTSEHINYLDIFIGKEIEEIKAEYNTYFNEYNYLKNELNNNYGDETEKQRKLDLLNYQLNEILNANLKINEDEELENQRKITLNYEKIAEGLETANTDLANYVLDYLVSAIKSLEKIEHLDKKYGDIVEVLRNSSYDIEEAQRDILAIKDDIYFNEEERDYIEKRLDEINTLKRKYGNTIEDIIEYSEELKKEIDTIQNSEEYIEKLKIELKNTEEKMAVLCQKMNELRSKHSIILSEKINNELKELEMNNANIHIKVDFEEEKNYSKNGLNKVEFLISTNIGEDFKPLTKIASGGEISRIVLAIKTIFANLEEEKVIVFDEIDTGISGKAAKAVSEKIQKISKNHQIFVVTHLAVIAAKAKNNFYICKTVENDVTKTSILKLDESETIKEIARILTGQITKTALKHAKELRYA